MKSEPALDQFHFDTAETGPPIFGAHLHTTDLPGSNEQLANPCINVDPDSAILDRQTHDMRRDRPMTFAAGTLVPRISG